ncbi:neutral/alkaline non-lysosomal ceramidase N-terminal domain-containing protein [Anditalea andensis]|uniref:Neutral/alkaline non-lysosomal ceramidase n=1 Tax=Anditalea andensis TaxID=1048983 RepID=A0A074KZK0_9BACT|nr:neutral/alkaline non-lysosomal ceramidase N-terminal domain-containing protein [Anditalea andensis]KEO73043.1 neutral/alkaline non-lysosomal ceramidase [Anditalea andensis]
MINKCLKIIAWVLGIFLLFILAVLAPIDNSDFREKEYYKTTVESITDLQLQGASTDLWIAGWSTSNITPDQPVSLVGYRPRGDYEFVQDSSYVKSLLIGNSRHTVAILNYELLIIHPYMAGRIKEAISKEGLPIDQVIFTATHTHSGLGGYIPGIMGKVAFGGYDEKIMSLFTRQTVSGLKQALANMDTVSITYHKTAVPAGVANRLIENGPKDPYIRQLILETKANRKATLYTYSAHATGLHSQYMGLSGDYPFYLNKALKEKGYEFSLFASGAVGSQRPVVDGREIKDIQEYAYHLENSLTETLPEHIDTLAGSLHFGSVKMELPSPHYRISDHIRLRPWIFHWLFGDTGGHIDLLLLGNTLFLTSSGEVSGEFYKTWDDLADSLDLNLIITTFNGGYIGYVTPDNYYHMKHHEVRDTHWFGPQVGRYNQEIINLMIVKASEAL